MSQLSMQTARGLGTVRIVNQEMQQQVFRLRQDYPFTPVSHDRWISCLPSIMDELTCLRYFTGETATRLDPVHGDRYQGWI